LQLVPTQTFISCMKQPNLCQDFAGRTRKIFLTSKASVRPFTSKEVMNISFGVSVFPGYKGLKWIRNFKVI